VCVATSGLRLGLELALQAVRFFHLLLAVNPPLAVHLLRAFNLLLSFHFLPTFIDQARLLLYIFFCFGRWTLLPDITQLNIFRSFPIHRATPEFSFKLTSGEI
jgi:hypothetical protein